MDNILKKNIESSGMKVPMATQRFPMIEGVQAKVSLKSKVTGTFMNIGFIAGIENPINGHIADRLLNSYPGTFNVIKVNGRPYMTGKKEQEDKALIDGVISKLKEQYDFIPKKESKPTERARVAEPKSEKSASTK